MRGQSGFWDVDERYVRLSEAGDPLEKLNLWKGSKLICLRSSARSHRSQVLERPGAPTVGPPNPLTATAGESRRVIPRLNLSRPAGWRDL